MALARKDEKLKAVLSNYDLAKFWTRTVGAEGERMITSISLLYRHNEGGGHKAVANLAFLRENLRAMDISQDLWKTWLAEKIISPPRAVIVRLGDEGLQGWFLLNETSMPSLSLLATSGAFSEELANDVLIDWEDKAFEEQWQQFLKVLPPHILLEFNTLSPSTRYRLAWDAYVHARDRLRVKPVTTFTKSVIPVHLLELEWLRYAKARFPYRRRGRVPKIA